MSRVSLGFENKLWEMADKLRGNIEQSEYKHVILGLVFLKYISDSFEERYNELVLNYPGMEEDRVSYEAVNVFFVPKEARWSHIKSQAKLSTIGQTIDNAMVLIERENASLKNVLPKTYGRPELDKTKLGELIDLFSFSIGDKEAKASDVLGRVYEYFLKKFGSREGEFYTPPSVVQLLVNMIEPFKGRVYDPCCGSGGMFVQSARFVEEHQGKLGDIYILGQEYTPSTWRLAKMNLAIRGIDANLGDSHGDTFLDDKHKNLKADYILANPPFNISDWGQPRLLGDSRWKWGVPSASNANYAWISHILSKLSPKGIAAFLLSSNSTSSEPEIRKKIIQEGFVKSIVFLPPKLFYSTPISPVIWIVSKNPNFESKKILFMDLSREVSKDDDDKKYNKLSDDTIQKTSSIFKKFLKDNQEIHVDSFAKSTSLNDIESNDYDLNPKRYINYDNENLTENKSLEEIKSEVIELSNDIRITISEIVELIGDLNET